jgi:MoxR-like ATPase
MKDRINRIIQALNENLYEREEVIRLSLLITIAGESIFLLGPPGVAKSLIARRLKHIFKGGKSFEYLMNRFSTPDEIFGPIAISKLKNEDKYERKTTKYLPWADVVFLDEIWKAGPSIQNSLLTAINEKKYRNGEQEDDISLKGLISASNELPAKGEGLEALWDRFIVRYYVENITDKYNFIDYLKSNNDPYEVNIKEEDKISNEEYINWQAQINKIKISEETINVINAIRFYLDEYNKKEEVKYPIYISDRRWKKIVKVLQTSAFLNDRKEIDLMDCFLITHSLWNEVEHIPIVKEFVDDAIKKHGYREKLNLSEFSEEIRNIKEVVNNKVKKDVMDYDPEPVIIGDTAYYEIVDTNNILIDSYGKHCRFIKKTDFEILKNREPFNLGKSKYASIGTTINIDELTPHVKLYDRSGGVFKNTDFYIYAIKTSPTSLEIFGGEQSNSNVGSFLVLKSNIYTNFNLKTKEIKKTVNLAPTETNRILLDKQINNFTNKIAKAIKDIETSQTRNSTNKNENIFVKKKNADYTKIDSNELIQHLHDFKIEAMKIKDQYDRLS